ncbi:Monocarboxylate transporter 5 [Trichostrongylus colubriformis]|uniref:Monocarboxylate transporter 5 n=1 Tax=Trichostrongylus colubriformis TaxID=6319 RepID=A0AAN8FT00_TRICO
MDGTYGQEQEADSRAYFEDEECGSLDGMNQEFDYSSLSINLPGADVAVGLLPVPPDGGYGWVIVLAAFFSNLIVDGVCTSFTEFKGAYSQHFHASDASTALIGSLLIGVYLLVGPVVGGLTNKYGARKVVIGGALISGTAFLISVAAPNIYAFMLIYGVVGGVGFGMIYLPAIVAVGYYFESKRAIATGIAVAGSGVGTMIMPIVCQYCISTIGWKYTVWILAVLVFLCALFGLLYRPLAAPTVDQKDHELVPLRAALRKMSEGDDYEMSSENDSPTKRYSKLEAENSHDDPVMARLRSALSECENDAADTSPSTPIRPPLSPVLENSISKSRAGSTHQTHLSNSVRGRKLTLTSLTSDMASSNDLKASRATLSGPQLSRISARSFAQSLSRLSNKGEASTLSIAMSGVDPQEFARPLNRQDIFYAGSIKNLKEFKQEGNNVQSYRGSVMSIPRSVVGQAVSSLSQAGDLHELGSRVGGSRLSRITGGLGVEDDDILDDFYDSGRCKWIPLPIRNAFQEMIDLELLKDSVMLLLCVSNVLGMLGFYIPFVFLKDLAHSRGVDPADSSYLVPLIGVTNTIGRVFFGWLADRGYVSALAINNFSLLACGALTLAAPFLPSFALLMTYAALFGFIISAYICLTSIVLSDLLGLEKLTNSFGLLVVARGIASLAGSPFAGLVYDVTQSYSATFFFAGFVIVVSGVISCAIPFVHKWKRSHGNNEGDDPKDMDNVSGKLSVLTERSEENLTEYQRTIQSLRQQYALLQGEL